MTGMTLKEMGSRALAELGASIDLIGESEAEALIEAIAGAARIAAYGVGREGLMMKALTMRLYHLGLDAHMVGDMTTPPIGPGDLLLVSAGPGTFSTVKALIETASAAGARSVCFTAQAEGAAPRSADLVVVLPAQTMAADTKDPASFLPMGSLYEGVQYLFFEFLVLRLRGRLRVTAEGMRSRHTNLE